jgi:hypothetical protein
MRIDLFTQPIDRSQENGRRATDSESLQIFGCFLRANVFRPQVTVDGQHGLSGDWLIDTGADHSAIRSEVVSELELESLGVRESLGINQGDQAKPIYEIQFQIPQFNLLLPLTHIQVAEGLNHYPNQVIGIIGRDVLAYCKLNYDGKAGACSLEYEQDN